jgi:AcrR family transcriptional regulator
MQAPVAAAAQVLERHGYIEVTLDDICAEAGVSTNLLNSALTSISR